MPVMFSLVPIKVLFVCSVLETEWRAHLFHIGYKQPSLMTFGSLPPVLVSKRDPLMKDWPPAAIL